MASIELKNIAHQYAGASKDEATYALRPLMVVPMLYWGRRDVARQPC
jgi:hypothetical protein